MRTHSALVFWSTVALVVLGVTSFYSARSILRMRQVAPFNQQIERFLPENTPSAQGPDEQPAATRPIVRIDKLLPINVATRHVDDVLFELPDSMQPTHVEQVRQVALLEWSERVLCTYVDKDGKATSKLAIQKFCHVRVIDLASRRLLVEEQIDGALPPERIRSRESSKGPTPLVAVAAYLQGLAKP